MCFNKYWYLSSVFSNVDEDPVGIVVGIAIAIAVGAAGIVIVGTSVSFSVEVGVSIIVGGDTENDCVDDSSGRNIAEGEGVVDGNANCVCMNGQSNTKNLIICI